MTCIAVKIKKNKIEIAGDTQSTWGSHKFQSWDRNDRQTRADGKIFQVNGMTLGCAGSVGDIGLLNVFCKTHKPKEMEKDFILDWFIEFKEWALAKAKVNFADINIHGILINEGKVFSFYDFMQVSEVKNFEAVGSGMWLAMGAMEVGATVEEAVKVAIKYDLYCSGTVTKITI